MELRIDRQALVPVVQQVVDALAGWIRSDAVEPGTRLPSIRQLARENLLSQSCVNEAYERMVAQGVLALRHGSVFFVAVPRSTPAPAPHAGEAALRELDTAPASSAPVLSGVLPLGRGGMPESWRESDDLSYAIRHISRTDMAGLFNYSTAFGLLELRQQLQRRLKQINVIVQEHQVLTTAGATHGLDLIIRTLLKPGDCVVVESPGYGNLFEQLRLWGVQMLEVPRTPKGPDVEALQALLASHKPRVLFINSLLHNPTGSNLTTAVIQRVLALAERYQLTIVEDDVYADFQGSTSPRLATLDTQGRVIYVGSFSKNLSSSLRVGYIAASAEMTARLAEVKLITSLGVSRFCEAVVAHLLANGTYRKLVQRQRQRLKREMCAALQSLEDAEWEVFGRPVGGLYIWARPMGCSPERVLVEAQRLGISLLGGAAFNPCGRAGRWLRINVAYANDPRAQVFFRACAASDRLQAF